MTGEIKGGEVSIAEKAKELDKIYQNDGNWNGDIWGFDDSADTKIDALLELIIETAEVKGV